MEKMTVYLVFLIMMIFLVHSFIQVDENDFCLSPNKDRTCKSSAYIDCSSLCGVHLMKANFFLCCRKNKAACDQVFVLRNFMSFNTKKLRFKRRSNSLLRSVFKHLKTCEKID